MRSKYELDSNMRRRLEQKKRERKRRMFRRGLAFSGLMLFLGIGFLYKFNIIPHRYYYNSHFGIRTYHSSIDKDADGVDDQTDILNGVRAYIKTEPKYKSAYYVTGYPNDEYGVCTDVVANGMRAAGYDLMTLVNADILAHPQDYDITEPDICIDFRRVRNLYVYFQHTAIPLSTDIKDIEEWQKIPLISYKR